MPADPTPLEHAATVETELASVARKARASEQWEGLPFGETDVSPGELRADRCSGERAERAGNNRRPADARDRADTAAAAGSEVGWTAFERHGWLETELKRFGGVVAEPQHLPPRGPRLGASRSRRARRKSDGWTARDDGRAAGSSARAGGA